MIPNFNTYNLLNESVTLKNLANGNKRGLGYADIKKGFLSKGYEFLGTLSMKVKTINAYAPDEILNTVPDEFIDKLKKCGPGYVTYTPDKSYLDMSIYKQGDDEFDFDKFLSYLASMAIEKVISFFTKKGKLYYALWNPEERYFYFAHIDDSTSVNNNSAIGFFELWLKIRTSGVDVVKKEIDEEYDKYLMKKSARDEEERARQEEKEAKTRKEKEYQSRVDDIKADVEANPENYVEVEEKDLPAEILDAINSDDYMDSPYAVYVEHGAEDPGGMEQATCYVNNSDLDNGYKFQKLINHRHPGQYVGD